MTAARTFWGALIAGGMALLAFAQDPAPASEKPRTAESWYQSAYDKRHNKELDGAIADATKAIDLAPKTGKYWLERGISRGNKGDLEGALGDFNQAVMLSPENADALRIRGDMKARLKDFDGALEDFAGAVRISPRFSRAYGDRADTYRQMGKPDLALADYNRALEIDHKYFWFCEARGDLLRSQGKVDLAASDYRSALETVKDEAVRNRLQRKLSALANIAPPGWTLLFNGKDLSGWKSPAGDPGCWNVVEGAIEGEARSKAVEDKSLWTQRSFKDFVLRVEWRSKSESGAPDRATGGLPNGTSAAGDGGKVDSADRDDLGPGILLRGEGKCRIPVRAGPADSGEGKGERLGKDHAREAHAGGTAAKRPERPQGEWNTLEITVKGDRLWVKRNEKEVVTSAPLPGGSPEGPIALEHRGPRETDKSRSTESPGPVQFRSIYLQELK